MSTPSEVTEFYARIWNAGDFGAIRSVAHDNFTFRGSLGMETNRGERMRVAEHCESLSALRRSLATQRSHAAVVSTALARTDGGCVVGHRAWIPG